MKKIYTLAFILSLFFASNVFGQGPYYVKNGGDNSKDGLSSDNAWATFSYAVSNAPTNSTIYVDGALSEASQSTISGKNLTIEGINNASLARTGTGRIVQISGTGTVSFSNITFQNASTTFQGSAVLTTSNNNTVTFEDCYFLNNETSALNGGGAVYIGNAVATFTRCTFYNNRNTKIDGRGAALGIGGSYDITINNSTFYQNRLTTNTNQHGAAIRIFSSSGAEIEINNSLFYDNTVSGGSKSDFLSAGASTFTFNNSIAEVATSDGDAIVNNSSDLTADLSNTTFSFVSPNVTFGAPNTLSDDTPIDFGSDNSDVGAWDSKINLFEGNTDSDWATGANWSSTSTPASDENVTLFSGTPAVVGGSTAAVCNNLSVNAGGSLSITSGGSLIVSGTSSGDVTYNRTLGTTNWYLMGSPVAGVTFNDTFVTNNSIASGDGNNRGVATYTTASDSWTYLQSGGSIASAAGAGYSVKQSVAGNIGFTGTINTSDVSVSVSTGGNGGFNLLGNPFTASLNSATFLTDNTANLVSQTIWVWNQATGNYETKVTADNFVLAPTQGFFARSSNGTNLSIAESYQTTGGTFQRSTRPEIHLLMTDGANERFAKLYYINGTTTGFDNGYDGEAFGGQSNAIDVYTHLVTDSEGKNFQVQSLPDANFDNMIVPVGVKSSAGKVTFTVNEFNLPSGYKVFLEDKGTGNFIRLDEDGTKYDVTFDNPVEGIGRFFLHMTTNVLSTGTVDLTTISAYLSDARNLRVVGIQSGTTQVQLFNILGKQVLNTSIQSKGMDDVPLPSLTQGVYIVQISSSEGTINKKIIIE